MQFCNITNRISLTLEEFIHEIMFHGEESPSKMMASNEDETSLAT